MSEHPPDQKKVVVELDVEEALVLFDFLASDLDDRPGAAQASRLETISDHDAALWAFNGVLCALEKVLAEPFRSDYDAILTEAKKSLVERYGSWPYSSIDAKEEPDSRATDASAPKRASKLASRRKHWFRRSTRSKD